MQRILIVEDSKEVQMIVRAILEREYIVVNAESIRQAKQILNSQRIDLIILDIVLPDGDGYSLCASLQSDGITRDIPIIFLSEKSSTDSKVMAFTLGAEDYVSKPFDPIELYSRVQIRLRKRREFEQSTQHIRIGDFLFKPALQKVYLDDQGKEVVLDLTPIEYKLLLLFVQHEEHVFTRDQLLTEIWSDNTNVYDRTVDTHISHLRKKIKNSIYRVKAVHGIGYRLQKDTNYKRATNKKAVVKNG